MLPPLSANCVQQTDASRNGAAECAGGHYQMDRLVFNGPFTKSANRSGLLATSYTEWGNTTRNKTRSIAVCHISEQSV